ncbi:hypothetical protein HYQ46_010479 [Verticillium longisporum]|nr:hypothetical protein HYQ46_010479 [Verticillium longisporum]
MALLVPNAHAALELLLHQRIFRNKTRRKASDANLLDTETISRGQRTSSAGLVGARGTSSRKIVAEGVLFWTAIGSLEFTPSSRQWHESNGVVMVKRVKW